MVRKVWLTTTHDATSALLKDSARFTVRKTPHGAVAGLQWWMPPTLRLLADNMLTSDDPDHRRLRGLVDQAFARRSIVGLGDRVREIAEDLLPQTAGKVELLHSYCRALPLRVIAELLGINRGRQATFSELAKPLSEMSCATALLLLMRPFGPLRRLAGFVREEIALARQVPDRGDLISALVAAEADGERLSERELVAMVFLLLIAGHETTTHMLAGSVIALAQNPEQAEMLRDEPKLDAMATEELLRFVSAVQMSKPRYVQQAGTFHGADLPEGALVMAGLAAANHDPAHVHAPSRLDLTRKPNPHLEFGTGIHFCLGFQLARMEIVTGIRVLLERHGVPRLGDFAYAGRPGLRTVARLSLR